MKKTMEELLKALENPTPEEAAGPGRQPSIWPRATGPGTSSHSPPKNSTPSPSQWAAIPPSSAPRRGPSSRSSNAAVDCASPEAQPDE